MRSTGIGAIILLYISVIYFGTLWVQSPRCEPVSAVAARAARVTATEFRMIATGEIRE